jgi:triacylglycerol lipase
VLSFRGTVTCDDWHIDCDCDKLTLPNFPEECTAHGGYWKAWSNVSAGLTHIIRSAASEHNDYGIVLTGHSLGGAVATLGAAALRAIGYTVDLVCCK